MKNNGIQKFENTEASRLVQNKIDELARYKKELAEATSLLSERKGYLNTFITLKEDAATKARADFATVVAKAAEYNNLVVQIDSQVQNIANLVNPRDAAFTLRNETGSDYETYTGYAQSSNISDEPQYPGTLTPTASTSTLQKAIATESSATAAHDTALNNYNVAYGKRPQQDKLVKNYQDKANNDLQPKINTKSAEVTSKTAALQDIVNKQIPAAETHKQSMETAKKTAETQLASAKQNQAGLEQILSDLEKANPIDQTKIDAAKHDVNEAKKMVNHQQSALDQAAQELTKVTSYLSTLNAGKQAQEADLESAQKALDDLKQEFNELVNNKLPSARAELKALKGTIDY